MSIKDVLLALLTLLVTLANIAMLMQQQTPPEALQGAWWLLLGLWLEIPTKRPPAPPSYN